ncbi:MAG: NAD-dependent epimerase/dehydratase family protein [Chloroflexi bacterium]|nr:NAD-dependent epimerase/dehydratase family protein [Chloroflexota bacterium]
MTDNSWAGRSVLVTGANGFIGAALLQTLVDLGARPVGYDLAADGALTLHPGLRERVPLVLGKTTDGDVFSGALAEHKIDTLFHLAANSNLGWARNNPVPVFESNIQGSWTVLEAARLYGKLSHAVVASSNTVYGEQQTEEAFTEEFPFNPTNPYAASKACTDVLTRCYAGQYGMPLAVVRATNTFGGADPNLKRIVPDTCLKLLRGERPVILSDGSPRKGYLYIKDTVSAYLTVAERSGQDGVRGQAFNFHPPNPVSVLELVRLIVKVSGRTDLEPEVRGAPGKYEYEFLSSAKAQERLGWNEAYTLEQALAETYAWYQQHMGAAELTEASDRFVRV